MSKYRFDQIAINCTKKKKPVEEDKYTYIGLEHLDSENLVVSRWGSEVAPIGEKLLMQKGDILFGKRRAYQKKVAIAPFDGIFSAHGMVLRPKEDVIDKNFFPLFISSDYFLEAAIAISVGSLSPTINWKDLAKLEFELPPLPEQKKLAEALWAINDTLQAYQKLLIETDELVKSQFIEMFVGKYPEITLGDEIKTTSGGTPSKKKEEYYTNGNIPWLTSGEVNLGYIDSTQNFITQAGLDNSSAKWVPENSVVIAMYGATAGKVGVIRIPVTTNQAICTLLPDPDFETLYLYYACKNKEKWMLSKCAGAAQPNISQTVIKEMQIEKPPIEDQKQFVEFVEQSDKSKFALQNAISAARETKRSIIADALGIKGKE